MSKVKSTKTGGWTKEEELKLQQLFKQPASRGSID